MQKTTRSPYFLALFASLGLALAPLGCGDKEAEDDSADDDTSTGDGDGDATGDGDGDGDGDTTTGDGDGDGDGDPDPTAGDGDGDEECVGEIEDGGACTSSCDCASGNCYLVPLLGGTCGECDDVEGDLDCAELTGGGCTPANPFDGTPPSCNMGELGGGCQTTDVCQDGLTCSTVLNLAMGLITIDTCGECEADADCTDGNLCAPIVNVDQFSGANTCTAPDSLELNEFCDFEEGGSGTEVCASGICSKIDVGDMGIAFVGACGECDVETNTGCDMGMTCTAGTLSIDTGTLTGSTCI